MKQFSIIVVTLTLVLGCKKKEDKTPPATQIHPEVAVKSSVAPEPTPPPVVEKQLRGKLVNCPSAVKGAKTTLGITKETVLVTVAATDAASIKAIQAKAKYLTQKPAGTAAHNGKRANTSAGGRCPTSVAGVVTEVTNNDKGAIVTMKPAEGAKLAELQKTVGERIAALEMGKGVHQHGSQKGEGGGGGDQKAMGHGDGLATKASGTKAGPKTGGGEGNGKGGGKPADPK